MHMYKCMYIYIYIYIYICVCDVPEALVNAIATVASGDDPQGPLSLERLRKFKSILRQQIQLPFFKGKVAQTRNFPADPNLFQQAHVVFQIDIGLHGRSKQPLPNPPKLS